MYPKRQTVTVTTDGAGAGSAFSERLTGRVVAIHYVKDATTPYDNGVDFTITLEATGESVWTESNVNASKTVRPVGAAHLPTGVTSTLTEVPIAAASDRLSVAVAAGGATKTGSFIVVTEGPWGGQDR